MQFIRSQNQLEVIFILLMGTILWMVTVLGMVTVQMILTILLIVKETEHTPEKLVAIKERMCIWRTGIKFNQVTEEKFEKDREVYDHLKTKLLKMLADILKKTWSPHIALMFLLSSSPSSPNMRAFPSTMPESLFRGSPILAPQR